MSPDIEKLLIIQDRDMRLLQYEQELLRIPRERREIEEKAKAAAGRLEELKSKAKLTESERKQLEMEAESKRTQANKYRSQQLLTKKNEEYQALQHEIDNTEKEVFRIEDRELDLMEKSEKLAAEIKKEQQVLAEVSAMAQRQRDDLGKREVAIKQEVEKLHAERAEFGKGVDESALSRYDRIMRHRLDVAIVPVREGICGGCHLQLPPQVVHEVRNSPELVTCEQCGRILYWSREFEPVHESAGR